MAACLWLLGYGELSSSALEMIIEPSFHKMAPNDMTGQMALRKRCRYYYYGIWRNNRENMTYCFSHISLKQNKLKKRG